MSIRDTDLKMLRACLIHFDENANGEHPTRNAFADMLERLTDRGPTSQLTTAQRTWVSNEYGKFTIEYEGDLVSSGKVPRGREVPTLPILDPAKLPKRPPGRAQ